MKSYIAYKGDRILYCCQVDETTADALVGDGVKLVSGSVDVNTHYMVGDTVQPRPPNPTTLEGNCLLNVPNPSTLIINNTAYVCEDGTVELEFDQPGIYKIKVLSWPELDTEFEYENQA